MIHKHTRRTWKYRALAKRIGYLSRRYRLTSLAIPVVMNDEFAEMQARRRASSTAKTDLDPQNNYTNQPDHDWIGASSPDDYDDPMAIGEMA